MVAPEPQAHPDGKILAVAMVPVRIPAGRVDGAVVELQVHPDDDIITATIRIPGPAAR